MTVRIPKGYEDGILVLPFADSLKISSTNAEGKTIEGSPAKDGALTAFQLKGVRTFTAVVAFTIGEMTQILTLIGMLSAAGIIFVAYCGIWRKNGTAGPLLQTTVVPQRVNK